MGSSTRTRILDAAIASFGGRGYDATSLDALAGDLGLSKQAVLYHFDSKAQLLSAVIDETVGELSAAMDDAVRRCADQGRDEGWDRVEAVVRAVFRLAMRRPALLGLLREVTRLGAPATAQAAAALRDQIERAVAFLAAEMDAGRMRPDRSSASAGVGVLDRRRGGHRSRGATRCRPRPRPALDSAAAPGAVGVPPRRAVGLTAPVRGHPAQNTGAAGR